MRLLWMFFLCVYAASAPIGIGDSIMGQLKPALPLEVKYFSGSGLSNPRIHNWTKVKLDPEGPVVVSFGTNDAQGISPHRFDTEAWRKAYAGRVSGIMKQAKAGRMLWILPARTGSNSLDHRLDSVRSIIVGQASIYNVALLDMRTILGESQVHNSKAHSRDKIHLSLKGINLVSASINAWLKGVPK